MPSRDVACRGTGSGVWLHAFADVNPVSLVIDAVRDLMNDGLLTAHVVWALVGYAVVVAIFAPLAVRSYSRNI